MKITDIRLRHCQAPVYRSFTNSLGTKLPAKKTWVTTIVEVDTDEGITGVYASRNIHGAISDLMLNYLRPLLLGENPLNYERLWRKMFGDREGWRFPAAKGETIRAMSVLDTVIWDIIGKSLGTPVTKLLGGFRDEIPCYASGGHYISLGDHTAEMDYIGPEMQRYMDMGFHAVKMRVGRNRRKDLERARLVRQVIGPDAKLMMDFNKSGTYLGGVSETIKFMRSLEEVDPYWFEDPLVMDDIAGMKRIATAVDTALATGEMEQTLWGFRDLVTTGAVDILLPDATYMCGGISEWRRIATFADAFRLPVAAHIGDVAHIHCVAAVPNGLIVEIFTPHDEGYAAHELNPIRRPNESGNVCVPQRSGLGLELDETYIARHPANN